MPSFLSFFSRLSRAALRRDLGPCFWVESLYPSNQGKVEGLLFRFPDDPEQVRTAL